MEKLKFYLFDATNSATKQFSIITLFFLLSLKLNGIGIQDTVTMFSTSLSNLKSGNLWAFGFEPLYLAIKIFALPSAIVVFIISLLHNYFGPTLSCDTAFDVERQQIRFEITMLSHKLISFAAPLFFLIIAGLLVNNYISFSVFWMLSVVFMSFSDILVFQIIKRVFLPFSFNIVKAISSQDMSKYNMSYIEYKSKMPKLKTYHQSTTSVV